MKNIIVMYDENLLEDNFFNQIKKISTLKTYNCDIDYDETNKEKYLEFIDKTFYLVNIYFIKYNKDLLDKLSEKFKILLLSEEENSNCLNIQQHPLMLNNLNSLFNNEDFVRTYYVSIDLTSSIVEGGYINTIKKSIFK